MTSDYEATQADIAAARSMLIDLCAPMVEMVENDAALHFAAHREQAERETVEKIACYLDEVRADHETRLDTPRFKTASRHHRDACQWAADALRSGGWKR